MDKQLYIPETIKVGFQNRGDTYTKKLAYVIYYDLKGELCKEKSWNTWCDKKIKPIDYTNEPTEGFVLNKKVGGHRSHWNYRDAHVRVYDPRDFEFEISVPNLLYILTQCDCSRGKGLEGKFVYAWDGAELVLLPSTSEEYKQSKSFTILQNQAVKAEITKAEKLNWITTCTFSYNAGSCATNLHVETNIRNLVLIASFLLEKERAYNEAATKLGVEAPVFQWQGFSVKDWFEDIKMRVNKIKLESLESRLNTIISPELRAQMELGVEGLVSDRINYPNCSK